MFQTLNVRIQDGINSFLYSLQAYLKYSGSHVFHFRNSWQIAKKKKKKKKYRKKEKMSLVLNALKYADDFPDYCSTDPL